MQNNRLRFPEKSLRLYLAAAFFFLVVTVIEMAVYITHSFGNSVENVASSFWLSGSLCLGNVGLYLFAKHKNNVQRRALFDNEEPKNN